VALNVAPNTKGGDGGDKDQNPNGSMLCGLTEVLAASRPQSNGKKDAKEDKVYNLRVNITAHDLTRRCCDKTKVAQTIKDELNGEGGQQHPQKAGHHGDARFPQ
jgi:hypothetical protein